MKLTWSRGDTRGTNPLLKQRLERDAVGDQGTCGHGWPLIEREPDFAAQPDDPVHEHRCRRRPPGHAGTHGCVCGSVTEAGTYADRNRRRRQSS